MEVQNLSIPNLNNKLTCEFFLHIAMPVNKFYNEILRAGYSCKNGKELLTLELLDYASVMLVTMSSAVSLPCTGLRAVDFIADFMAKNHCPDTQAVGVYFFKVVKREILTN